MGDIYVDAAMEAWLEEIGMEEAEAIHANYLMHALVGDDGDPLWGWV